jgi:hypothetical protein
LTRRAACRDPEVIAAALEQSVHASISGPAPALVSGPAPAATTKGKAELSFLPRPAPPVLLMCVNNAGKTPGSSHWTPFAFVGWDKRSQKYKAAGMLKGPNGKAKSKMFATDHGRCRLCGRASRSGRVRASNCVMFAHGQWKG